MFAASFFILALVALASAVPTKRAPAQVITQCTVPNTVALTFDDGPYVYSQKIVDQLTDAGAVGTFFFNGDNWSCIYDEDSVKRVQYAFSKGHQVASHTWSHPDMTTLNHDQMTTECSRIDDALKKIVGVVPAFARPPYGSYNDLFRQVAQERGQRLVNWDFDSGDSTGSTPAQSKAMYDSTIARHPNTLLALNHEVYETTADEVLPYAIQKLQAAGYKLVSVAECLDMKPYQFQGSPTPRNSSWTC